MPTNGLAESSQTAPVLLLGLGNPLMGDDGAGLELLARLSCGNGWDSRVEFLDGGTQGLALLGRFDGRKAVVFLDAVRLGHPPGSVHVLTGEELGRMGGRVTSAHEGSAPQILAALQLLNETPEEIVLVGIEPQRIETRMGLTPTVESSIGIAAGMARMTVNRVLARPVPLGGCGD